MYTGGRPGNCQRPKHEQILKNLYGTWGWVLNEQNAEAQARGEAKRSKLFKSTWSSLRGKRARWCKPEVIELAVAFLEGLPDGVSTAMLNGTLHVNGLFSFKSEENTDTPAAVATKDDVITNYSWIRPAAVVS